MDSLISQPDDSSDAKKTDLETAELLKDAEDTKDLANGNSEESKENGKSDSTTDENFEDDVRLIGNSKNVESSENIQKENSDQSNDKSDNVDSTSDKNERNEELKRWIIESSFNDLEKDAEIEEEETNGQEDVEAEKNNDDLGKESNETKISAENNDHDEVDLTETNEVEFVAEKSGQEDVEAEKNNDDLGKESNETEISAENTDHDNVDLTETNEVEFVAEKSGQDEAPSTKNNDKAEEPIEVEDCVTEPDLPIFDDIENENHIETGVNPMEFCEILSDKDDHLDILPHEQEHYQGNNGEGDEIIRNFLPDVPSVPKRKSKKANDKKKSEVVQMISDDSGTESDSSTENVGVEELKESITTLLEGLQPKVLSKEQEEVKQHTYQCKVQYSRLHCTACNKHMGSALSKQKDRYIHPMLKVLVCKSCYNFYTSGDFEKDEDGSELYCRWCGQGGKVICCSKCAYVFCTKCISRNCGNNRLRQIKSVDDWLCFVCNPSPLEKIQTQCTALIDYLRKENTRLSGLSLNSTDLYRKDYSNCCSSRKRKAKDTDFSIEEELSVVKKPRTAKVKSNTIKPILNTDEQEEVVCAPDLLSFMAEDDLNMNADDVTIEKPSYSRCSPSPLQPRTTTTTTVIPTVPILNNYRFVTPVILPKNAMIVQNPARNTVIVQTSPPPAVPKPKPALVHNPASMMKSKGKQVVLNSTLKNPITSNNIGNLTSSVEKVSTHKITLKTPNQTLPKLVPGLKHEWFDSASKTSLDIQTKLSCSIAELSIDKLRATTMEDLATIHNKFQEVLSKSINSMIQIRRTLRNDFLASLNSLKFIKNVQETKDDDDDVVFVKSTAPAKPTTVNDESHGPYLKVRPVSQLLNVPSECITIPDEVIEKISENKKEDVTKKVQEQEEPTENSCDISNDSNKENVESFTTNTIEIDDDEKDSAVEEVPLETSKKDNENPQEAETEPETQESQKAIFEKKIAKLVNDNLKYNVSGISVNELKRMLSVRVYVSKDYKPKQRNQN